jgi:hypothetical protein
MVRPIEITDSLSKVQAVERMQQQAKAIPETVQQFQTALDEKLMRELVTTASPAPPGDQILLHAEEREKKKLKAEDGYEHEEPREEEHPGGKKEKPEKTLKKNYDHIDIKI